MNKTQKYLIALLGLQIILIVVVFLLQRPVAASNNLIFPDLKIEAVTDLKISDSSGNLISIQKSGEGWVLPLQDDYPVQTEKIQELVDKLSTVRDNRLVTRSESSHDRLSISDNNFDRKVEITINGKSEVIYFGSSPAANNIHFRLSGKPEVYLTNALTNTNISTSFSSWVDTIIFQIGSNTVNKIVVNSAEGSFVFEVDSDSVWSTNQVAEGFEFDQSKWSSLFTGFTTLRFVEPVSKTDQAKYGFDTPLSSMQIFYSNDAGEPLTREFVIGSQDDSGNYYAKWSGSEYIYKISSFNAERFINLTTEEFSSPIPTEEPDN
jgi:hypothetical protein